MLVVSEAFPRADEDKGVQKLLSALLELGHIVTFIARERLDRRNDESDLQSLGIATYADDQERLRALGKPTSGRRSWRLEQVLSEVKFDFAILTENFESGISIPEQYLDAIRQNSGRTRIVVWTRCLYRSLQRPTAHNRLAVQAFERNQNWVYRQKETFERADLVLLSDQDGLISLLRGTEMRGLGQCQGQTISKALSQTRKAVPQLPAGPFSILLVETLFAGQLASRMEQRRLKGHLECYVMLADLLLKQNKVAEARDQLRHVFGRMDGSWDAAEFVIQVIVLLKRCYRMLGDPDLAEIYGAAARDAAVGGWASTPLGPPAGKKKNTPLISLIVPTYNRLPILRKCLAAIEAQTLPKDQFEVIVIDDGSTDGSEEFLRLYRPEFRFQYLRQANSGTGAARRHGVSQAAGDYLLLMNDDTICDQDAVEQHLAVQRRFGSQRWAVLGSFEYPAAARQRALTHYFCVEPFMFPQASMEEGCPYSYSYFITCNLSVRRDAVTDVGSFAPFYKLSEDTEMGLRLFEKGYRVLYHPAAHAWHDHLPYPARNLIRRARVYGADYFHMFRQHPRVMQEWAMPVPLTAMDEVNATRILAYVEANRKDVEEAVQALEKWDDMDFASLLERNPDTAAMVLNLFRQAVPAIHWFYLYETMLQTIVRELHLVHMAPNLDVVSAGASVGS